MAFSYNCAIVREFPKSFQNIFINADTVALNEELQVLMDILQRIGIDVFSINAEERYPQCPLIDDLAIVINNSALMCNPPGGREPEVRDFRRILKHQLKLLSVQEMKIDGARLKGSDVLFTGKEILVGIGDWTNELGAQCVAKSFPEYSVTILRLQEIGVSLKDQINMAGASLLAIGGSKSAQRTARMANSHCSHTYRKLSLADSAALSLIYANGYLIHLDRRQIGDESYSILTEKIEFNRKKVYLPEMAKCGLSISTFCLLISRQSVKDLKAVPTTLV